MQKEQIRTKSSTTTIIIDLKLFLTLFIIVCFLRTLNEKTPVLFEVN